MARVSWVVLLAVLLAGCGGEPSGEAAGDASTTAARDDQVFRWKLVTTWPKNLPVLGTAPEAFAKNLAVMSGGRLQIDVYGAGELTPAFGVFDAVSSGTAEMGHGASYYWRGKIPVAAIFSTVPFGMNAREMSAWLHYGGGMELWQELYAPFGIVPMDAGNTGVQMAGWFNREINSIADIEGLTMRIPGLGGEVFERAGGAPVTLPGGDIFTAMQTGVVDATEWVGPYNDLAFGLHTIGEYYYYPGWHEPGPALELLVNAEALAALPPDLDAMLRTAVAAMSKRTLDEFTARNMRALQTLVNEHGVELRRLPDDVLETFKSISADVVRETAADSALAKRILDSYRSFQEDIRAYHAITEEAYYQVR